MQPLMSCDGEENVDRFGIDCRSEHITECVPPFLIAENDQTTFILRDIAHCIIFQSKVHFCWNDLIPTASFRVNAHLRQIHAVVASEAPLLLQQAIEASHQELVPGAKLD